MLPHPLPVISWTIGVAENASDERQADLSGVNVTAETEMDTRSSSLVKYFRRVSKQNLEGILRHTFESAIEVVKTIAVRIIHAN